MPSLERLSLEQQLEKLVTIYYRQWAALKGREKWDAILRTLFAAIFILSGTLKLQDIAGFIRTISFFRLLPVEFGPTFALTIIISEIVLGCLILINFWVRRSLYALIFLLAVFTTALLSAVIRGIDLSCGCFGPLEIVIRNSGLRTVASIARNAGLAVLALYLARPR